MFRILLRPFYQVTSGPNSVEGDLQTGMSRANPGTGPTFPVTSLNRTRERIAGRHTPHSFVWD